MHKNSKNSKAIAIIVAAGRASRMGGDIPKQYMNLRGKSILQRSIEAFADHNDIDSVLVVINHDDEALYNESVIGLDIMPYVLGGATRQESVLNGLCALENISPDYVLIHDAARPFVSKNIISSVVEKLDEFSAVAPVIPIADTIKELADEQIKATISRDNMALAQTPQGFAYKNILELHKNSPSGFFTDDISLFELKGDSTISIAGDSDNFKITTKDDFLRAKMIVEHEYETRVGTGLDVHAFHEQKCDSKHSIMLCGVEIPHDKDLKGHSDADVAIHAIVDAILGSIGEGDIGLHFPPSDDKWKGENSSVFLKYANELLKKRDCVITNIDVTIICENPKISQYRKQMQSRISEILSICETRVNVKGTTTEGLGFAGRGEGIAAQAVATVSVKK